MRAFVNAVETEGFVVVPDVLSPEKIAQLLEAFEVAPTDRGTQHVEIGPGTPHAAAWSELLAHPLTSALAAAVLPRPALFTAHGRNPLPGYGQQGLHADSPPREPGEGALVVRAIWMLDHFTLHNGATRVVPGTHRLAHPVPRAYAQPAAHHPDEIVVTGDAGSVLVLNGHLWHSGTLNRSDGPRRAVQMTARAD